MEEKDFNGKVTVDVSATLLQNIYRRFEDEPTPHAIRVSRCRTKVRRITIYCDAENIKYFINKIVKYED
ncbi:hypothetical protein [uncultured Bacteroides sp.]|uniref:hypothetical protein n=1 Tax=uncultured Bacteroides sp. TaxID=162156 RepID=UPI00260538F2|nr:hypothetical protein [uncultured Bacteroides sp.]